jgi:hypothetical protein
MVQYLQKICTFKKNHQSHQSLSFLKANTTQN